MKKKITINYLYSSFYQLVLIIVPFITAPYLAKTLRPNATAINSYVSAVVQLFSSIGLLGLNNYAIREVAYVRNNKDDLTKLFSEIIKLRFILMIVTTIVYLFYAYFSEYRFYFLIQLVAIVSAFIDISWLYMGLEEFKMTVTRSLIVKIVFLISIFTMIKSPKDLGLFMFLSTIYTVIGNIILYFGVRKRINKPKFTNVNIKRHFMPMLKLFLPYAATLIYLQVDKIMIKTLAPEFYDVGFYDQAERLVKIPLALITALSSVMLPRVSNEFKQKNDENVRKYVSLSFNFSMYMAIPLMLGIFSISYTMVPWFFGYEYLGVIPIMMIVSPIVFFNSLSAVCGNQYLTAINDTKTLTKSYCIGAVLNLIFNALLIPILSGKGAAIGTIIAEGTVFVIQYQVVKKIIDTKEVNYNFVKYLTCGFIMFFTCNLIGTNMPPTAMTTIIQVAAGIGTYLITLIIIKDKLTYMVIETVINKIKTYKKEHTPNENKTNI